MISFRSAQYFIVAILLVLFVFYFTGIVELKLLGIVAYILVSVGISFFYTSFLKKLKSGITIGSILFLSGSTIFVFSKYEILNFGVVFVPSFLFVLGAGLLISNLLLKFSKLQTLLSILMIVAGVWIVVLRSTTNVDLFFASVLSIVKNYWLIFLVSGGLIYLAGRDFKKRDSD